MDWGVEWSLFQCFSEKVERISWSKNERKDLSCQIKFCPRESLILLHRKACLHAS